MPTVAELTALYENVMLAPRPGPGVCRTCFNFTRGFERCYACTQAESWLGVVAPISYSVGREQLHHALSRYKRMTGEVARRLALGLAALLWRFLARHERCVAAAVGAPAFSLVTTVPSGDPRRDEGNPLRWIVGEIVGPTRERHERLLRRSEVPLAAHQFSREKFRPIRPLRGEAILLIDDTWTTGASAQSAAAALTAAGAGPIGAVVIGRHLNRDWHENDRRLRGIERPFDWGCCALEQRPGGSSPSPQATSA